MGLCPALSAYLFPGISPHVCSETLGVGGDLGKQLGCVREEERLSQSPPGKLKWEKGERSIKEELWVFNGFPANSNGKQAPAVGWGLDFGVLGS